MRNVETEPTQSGRAQDAPSVWQPIETAPRDGTEVLIWCEGRRLVAEFGPVWGQDQWMVRMAEDPRAGVFKTVTRLGPEHDENGNLKWGSRPGPTLWQPLPEPPTDEARPEQAPRPDLG